MKADKRAHSSHRLIANVTAGSLIVIGLVGLSTEIGHLFGFEEYIVHNKDHALLLTLLGLVAVALGLERLLLFKDIEHDMDQLTALVTGLSGCRLLKGREEIYAAAIVPVNHAKRHFRSLVAVDPAKAPVTFAEAVARRLRERLDSGDPMTFDVAFAAQSRDLTHDFRRRLNERIQVYAREGVDQLIAGHVIDTDPLSIFDMFIVDSSWAVISFPTILASAAPQVSIVFNDPQIVLELVDWYDKRVLGRAKRLSEVLSQSHH